MLDLTFLPAEIWFSILKFCSVETLYNTSLVLLMFINRNKDCILKNNGINYDISSYQYIVKLIKQELLNRFIVGKKLLSNFNNTWKKIDNYNSRYKNIMKYAEIYELCNSNLKLDFEKYIIKNIIMNIMENLDSHNLNNKKVKNMNKMTSLFRYPFRHRGVITFKEYTEGIYQGKKIYYLMFC